MKRCLPTTTCPHCEKEVIPIEEDVGIGSYEFWGQKCHDTRMAYYCPECEEPLEDYAPEWDDGADAAYEQRQEDLWYEEHGKD